MPKAFEDARARGPADRLGLTPAVRAPDGQIFTGSNHGAALNAALAVQETQKIQIGFVQNGEWIACPRLNCAIYNCPYPVDPPRVKRPSLNNANAVRTHLRGGIAHRLCGLALLRSSSRTRQGPDAAGDGVSYRPDPVMRSVVANPR